MACEQRPIRRSTSTPSTLELNKTTAYAQQRNNTQPTSSVPVSYTSTLVLAAGEQYVQRASAHYFINIFMLPSTKTSVLFDASTCDAYVYACYLTHRHVMHTYTREVTTHLCWSAHKKYKKWGQTMPQYRSGTTSTSTCSNCVSGTILRSSAITPAPRLVIKRTTL